MFVDDWQDSLLQFSGRVGPEGLPAARLAQAAIDDLRSDRAWIGHDFPAAFDAEGKPSKSDLAYRAQRLRDAVLALAVGHEFLRRAAQPGAAMGDLRGHVHEVVDAALASTSGLRAQAVAAAKPGVRFQPVDFAHGPEAKKYFEQTVGPKLDRVDGAYGTTLRKFVGNDYDPADDPLIERWGRAWSAAACAAFLDWAFAKNLHTPLAIVRALWLGSLPGGQALPAFHVRRSPLPSGSSTVHVDLRTSRRMGQIVEGRQAHWTPPHDEIIGTHIPIAALDYRSVAGAVFHHGRDIRQLFLVVLAECLR